MLGSKFCATTPSPKWVFDKDFLAKSIEGRGRFFELHHLDAISILEGRKDEALFMDRGSHRSRLTSFCPETKEEQSGPDFGRTHASSTVWIPTIE